MTMCDAIKGRIGIFLSGPGKGKAPPISALWFLWRRDKNDCSVGLKKKQQQKQNTVVFSSLALFRHFSSRSINEGSKRIIMMSPTRALCTFPSASSHLRRLKRPHNESRRGNPSSPLSSVQQMFSFLFFFLPPPDLHKKASVLFPGLSIPPRSEVTGGLGVKPSLQV